MGFWLSSKSIFCCQAIFVEDTRKASKNSRKLQHTPRTHPKQSPNYERKSWRIDCWGMCSSSVCWNNLRNICFFLPPLEVKALTREPAREFRPSLFEILGCGTTDYLKDGIPVSS